jgi:hypothetical protein
MDWGIEVWPEIAKSAEGNLKRAQAAAAKQKSLGKTVTVAPQVAKSVSESSATVRTSNRLRLREVGDQGRVKTPGSVSATPERVERNPSFPVGPTYPTYHPALSRIEQMAFENLSFFEEAGLRAASRSSISVRSTMSEVQIVRDREAAGLSVLVKAVQMRQELIDSLLVTLKAEADLLEKEERQKFAERSRALGGTNPESPILVDEDAPMEDVGEAEGKGKERAVDQEAVAEVVAESEGVGEPVKDVVTEN